MQRICTLILHLRAHGHIVEHRARLLLRFCAAVGNCSIRQSISKWIQNIFISIAVGSSCHTVIGELRQIFCSLIESHRQFSVRCIIAEQRLCHGFSAARTRIPAVKNSRYMLLCPGQVDGTSCRENEDNRFSNRCDRLQQFLL